MREYEKRKAELEELRVALSSAGSYESILENEALADKLNQLYAQLDEDTIEAAMSENSLSAVRQANALAEYGINERLQQNAYNANTPLLEAMLGNNALLGANQIATTGALSDLAMEANKSSLNAQFGANIAATAAQQRPTVGLLESIIRVGSAASPLLLQNQNSNVPGFSWKKGSYNPIDVNMNPTPVTQWGTSNPTVPNNAFLTSPNYGFNDGPKIKPNYNFSNVKVK
jgi:hypothetical protein